MMWQTAQKRQKIEWRNFEPGDSTFVDRFGVSPGIHDKIARDPNDHGRIWVIKAQQVSSWLAA